MNDVPLVTVLIPARNEADDIEECLRAVLAQDYPQDAMEIVLVDGGSTDDVTRRTLATSRIAWRIVDNPVGTTPSSLNCGLAVASGRYTCRVDARSVIEPHYVSTCVRVLAEQPETVVTGGSQVAVARDPGARAQGIARALNNRFTMGGARYRSGASSGSTDTVYLGAFRTEQLREAGGWDEYYNTNQDYELNRRMAGFGTVWFDDRLKVGYLPRTSFRALWQQYHRFGRWKVRYWRRTKTRPERRQWIVIAAPPCAAALLVWLLQRHRRSALGAVLAVPMAIDVRGGPGPAQFSHRVVGQLAAAVIAGAWWSGVVREWFSEHVA